MPKRSAYIKKRNTLIKARYKELRKNGNSAKYSIALIEQELRGELSYEWIRRIIYTKDKSVNN